MQTPQGETYFHQETDAFDLTVTLNKDKLTFKLKDLTALTIYSKQYSEADIGGGEISRKMELLDVFNAFSQTHIKTSKQSQASINGKKIYEFGSVVQHKGNPCYKIDKDGKITVYLNLLDKSTNKDITYISNLTLIKTGQLTSLDFISQRADKELFDKLSKKIEILSQEKEELLRRVLELQSDNIALKQCMQNLQNKFCGKMERFQQKINQMNQKNQRLQEKLSETYRELKSRTIQIMENQISTQCNLEKKIKQTVQEFTQANQQSEQKIKEQLIQADQQNQRLQQKFNHIMQKFELQNQRSLDKFQSIESDIKLIPQNQKQISECESKEIQILVEQFNHPQSGKQKYHSLNNLLLDSQFEQIPINLAENLYSLPQANSTHFKIHGLILQYTSQNNLTQYIFNLPIPHPNPNEPTKFKLKIIKMQTQHMTIGIVDYAKQKNHRYSYSSGNSMCYYGGNGNKFPERAKEGGGFKQGDFVEVVVDRSENSVKYNVNGIRKATQINQMLADSSRIFMPYVEMCKQNDSVQWMP